MSYQVPYTNKVLLDRLSEIDITPYQVAKRVGQLRGQSAVASRYSSMVNKVFDNLDRSKVGTLLEMLSVMGGRLIIEWDDPPPQATTKLESLEAEVEHLKAMLSELLSKHKEADGRP